MKKILLLFAAVLMMAGLSNQVMAQSTASATATATIITPITLAKDVDMNFGNVAVNAAGGTVILAPASTRTAGGGVTLPAVTGTVTAASFTVTGSGTSTYSITLPTGPYTITKPVTLETMTVTAFTSTPSGTGALTGGTQTINVGATLNVGVSQVAGVYTNATGFDVTVNYN